MKLKDYKLLVDQTTSIVAALKRYNPTGRYDIGQPCFCPFHENENTPAAALYGDEEKETLYCFSERKIYTASDVLEKLLNYDIYSLGQRIWTGMSEADQQAWLTEHSKTDYEEMFSQSEEKETTKHTEESQVAIDYKLGRAKVSDLLNELINKKL